MLGVSVQEYIRYLIMKDNQATKTFKDSPVKPISLPIVLDLYIKKSHLTYTIEDLFSVFDRNQARESEILNTIVSICNQDLVYNNLFAFKLAGIPYDISKAQEFKQNAIEGWANKTHFVFGIFDPIHNYVGSIDIKSNQLDGAQIGYWMDCNHKGVMSLAINQLLIIARKLGFTKLCARAKTTNLASQRVLIKNGFIQKGTAPQEADGVERLWFECELF